VKKVKPAGGIVSSFVVASVAGEGGQLAVEVSLALVLLRSPWGSFLYFS